MIFESSKLFNNKDHYYVFFAIVSVVFAFHLSFLLAQYHDFKQTALIQTQAQIINIYHKPQKDILKLKTPTFSFFTSVPKSHQFKKAQYVFLTLVTQKVAFIDYLKGFYSPSFNIDSYEKETLQGMFLHELTQQHENHAISELFSALFLAIPLNESLRDYFASWGLSHLIAISGFHLGVLSACLYFLCNSILKPLHQRCCPYRNRRVGIAVFIVVVLLSYLVLTNIAPSLLRAYVMFILALVFLRFNVNVLSFHSLFASVCIILMLFPSYVFSLSLWFSVLGVFYIFLFLKYTYTWPKKWIFICFNVWIFLSFNPLVHFFFPQTSLNQLLSPLLTLGFTLFYPLELALHFLGLGNFLDEYIEMFLSIEVKTYEIWTPLWFFVSYCMLSLYAVFCKNAFFVLNIMMVVFNAYVFGVHYV